MGLQQEFIKFNEKIKLDYDTNAELREKRDILVNKLNKSGKLPSFEIINQGSYGMYTGVNFVDKEYDIDVGLRFNENKDQIEPMDLKKKICNILKNHTEYGAVIKNPCVTVTYKKDGEAAYHVDLVVYTYEDKDDKQSQMYLARGKDPESENTCWEKSDPKGLVDYVNNHIKNEEERKQFRRLVRYIKTWKNLRFASSGNIEPPSIGITLLCVEKFRAYKDDDLNALITVLKEIKALFKFKRSDCDSKRELYRLECIIPTSLNFNKNTDVFKKMCDSQMTDFKDKLDKLIRDLDSVKEEVDELEQCLKLNKIFGDDFERPDKKDVYKQQNNYIPQSSESGIID